VFGKGKNRIAHFFNTTAQNRMEFVKLLLWDWPGEIRRLIVDDVNGNPINFEIENDSLGEMIEYCGHTYLRIFIDVTVPAYGYATYVIREDAAGLIKNVIHTDMRTHSSTEYVFENDKIKVTFDKFSFFIISIIDKATGHGMIGQGGAGFRLIDEDTNEGMSSWIVGRYNAITDLHRNVRLIDYKLNYNYSWLEYEIKFRSSDMKVKVSLKKGSSMLEFDVTCGWQEIGKQDKSIPQLNFSTHLNYECEKYKYDIPFGTIDRVQQDMDMPANSWAMGISESGPAIMAVTRTKNAYRGYRNHLNMTLIRGSFYPDAFPEVYSHQFKFALAVVNSAMSNAELIAYSDILVHPIFSMLGTFHEGTLPLTHGFIKLLKGNVTISAIKKPEQGDGMIIRIYESEGQVQEVAIEFDLTVESAWIVDLNETIMQPLPNCTNSANKDSLNTTTKTLNFTTDPYKVTTIHIVLDS